MDSDKNFIVYLCKLIQYMNFGINSTWILINPIESVRNLLSKQSKSNYLKNFLIYQDIQLKDQEDAEFNRLEKLIPFKTYYFIDTLASMQMFAHQIPEYSFVIIPNKIGENLDSIIFDENKWWRIVFMTSTKATIIGITPNSVYRFLMSLRKKFFKELIEDYEFEVRIALDKVKMTESSSDFQDFFNFEEILPMLEIIEKKIVEFGYIKKNNQEDLVDLMYVLLEKKCYEKNVIILREFIIEGIIEKIKNLIIHCKSHCKIFFEELRNLNTFLYRFPISSLIFKTLRKPEFSGLYISFIIDYLTYSNIDNLLSMNVFRFYVGIIDEVNEEIIFRLIKGEFTVHMLKLIKKQNVMQKLKKLNRIPLDSASEEKFQEIFRQKLKNLNVEELNESMYEIRKKNGGLLFAYPNKMGLKFMLKETIPTTLLILLGKDKYVKINNKSLIGGEIALKFFFIDEIKKNLSNLSNLVSGSSENDVELKASYDSEMKVCDEEEKHTKIKELKVNNSDSCFSQAKNCLKNFAEIEGQKINGSEICLVEEKAVYNEFPLVEEIKVKNIIKIKKPYRELSYLELNELQSIINLENILLFNDERIEITKVKVIRDKLIISKVAFFIVLAHEIFNSMRSKFATNSKFINMTPENMLFEAGLYIDKAVYGNYMKNAKLNPKSLTLEIAEKVLKLEDLTQKEADSIYPPERNTKASTFGCDEYEYEYEDDNEKGEWL